MLQLPLSPCSYNFINLSMCSYNFNVAVGFSINPGGGSNLQDIEEKHGIVSDISIGYKNKYVLQ